MRPLTVEEVRASARGCVEVRAAEAGLEFMRFQPGTLAYYEAKGEGATIRSRAPAGVVLDFLTDSEVADMEQAVQGGYGDTKPVPRGS